MIKRIIPTRIQNLNLGVKRLLLLLSVPLSISAGSISYEEMDRVISSSLEGAFIGVLVVFGWLIGTFIVFWLVTVAVLWVIEGFNS